MEIVMKNFIVKSLLAAVAAFSISAQAVEYGAKVDGLYVNGYGTVMVSVDPAGRQPPACNGGMWDFSFDLNSTVGQTWFSYLLAAKTTGKAIIFGFAANDTGRCTVAYLYQLD